MRRIAVQVALTALAIAVTAVGWHAVVSEGALDDVAQNAAFLTTVVIAGQVVGWSLGRRHPVWWTGPLVQVVSVVVPLASVRDADVGALVPNASTLWLATILLPALVLLRVPDRIGGRLVWWATLLGIGVTAALARPIVDEAGRQGSPTWWHVLIPRNPDDGARRLFAVHTAVVGLTLLVVCGAVVRHYRATRLAARPMLRPVLFAGLAWAAVTVAGQIGRTMDPDWAMSPFRDSFSAPGVLLLHIAPQVGWAAVLAAATWVALIAPRLGRTTEGALTTEAGGYDVDAYLRRALADPSVKVAYRSPDGQTWRDRSGRPVDLAADDDAERSVTLIVREGTVLGALESDAAIANQPEVIELVGAAAGLAVETAWLAAVANARVEDARRLTARLVTSAEDARRDLQQVLENGPLQALERLALLDGEVDWNDVARRLEEIAADVRRISHGIFPPSLTEHGLSAVLTGAASVPTDRYPPSVEVTAFLAAKNDPSARVVQHGTTLRVELGAPCVDPVVADRVAVLGGTIDDTTILIPIGV